jgi:hypothetical protein
MKKISHTGRPSLLESGLSIQDLISAYEKGGSARAAAKLLGCEAKAVRKHLRAAGYTLVHTSNRRGLGSKASPALLLEWMRAHPQSKLPRSIKGISAKTGIPVATIKRFLLNRRKRLQAWLEKLPTPEKVSPVVFDNTSMRIPSDIVEECSLHVEMYELKVNVCYVLRGFGPRKLDIPYKEYLKLIKVAEADAPWGKGKLLKDVEIVPKQ